MENNENNSSLRSFVICRMYAGKYISTKMGGEIINLLHDDNDNNYVYVNPRGYIAKKYDNTVKGVLLVRLLQKGVFEVLGIARIGPIGQLVYPKGKTTKEKHRSTGEQLMKYESENNIRYDGVKLSDIFYGKLDGAITFKSEVLLQPIKPIFLTDSDHGNIMLDNETINLSDKRFPVQSLISYIDSELNKESFETINKLMNDTNSFWSHKKNKVRDNQLADKNFNFLNIIKKDEDELVYSNLLYYFLSRYPNLMIGFAKCVLDINLTLPYNIEREKANIDLLIEDNNNIIIIENKIKAGISGVSPRHDFSEEGLIQSQLSKYHKYGEKIKGERASHYFIFLPVYNKIDINKYSASKYYKRITYQELYDYFLRAVYKNEELKEDDYYQEFIKTLYKHTNVIQDDYYQEMADRFLQRIKQVKIQKNKEKEFLKENYKKLNFSLVNVAKFNQEQEYFERTLGFVNKVYQQNQSLAKKIIIRYFQNEQEVLIGYLLTSIQNSEINIKGSWFVDMLKSRTNIKDERLLKQINKLITKVSV